MKLRSPGDVLFANWKFRRCMNQAEVGLTQLQSDVTLTLQERAALVAMVDDQLHEARYHLSFAWIADLIQLTAWILFAFWLVGVLL